jgi:1-acyl-sn-glycerol-3-phosphate acyltransferase
VHRTILDTPILTPILRPIARLGLRLFGWTIEGGKPEEPKYVLVAAPHTSNLDALVLLAMAAVLRVKLFWMGKSTLFRAPFGWLMRWFGGIPVERRHSTDMVQRMAEIFRGAEELVVTIPPEATRGKSTRWKTGFYYIAVAADVPIALGFLDWGPKIGGIGPMFEPTGDIEADMPQIQDFYRGMTGHHADRFGDVTL